jgi:hypothetical protein
MSEPKLTPSTLVELLRRGLNVGIPPTALANMFDLDAEVVKNLAVNVRRETFGTAELSEKLAHLTWQAVAAQEEIIRHGSPELKLKATMAVLGKALATSVRQTPEEVKRAREELLAVARQERILEIEGVSVEQERSSFVAVDVEADDQGQGREAQASQSR